MVPDRNFGKKRGERSIEPTLAAQKTALFPAATSCHSAPVTAASVAFWPGRWADNVSYMIRLQTSL